MADGNESIAITILSGLLSGGVASAAVTYFFESRREERNKKREKLEALYEDYDHFSRILLAANRTLKDFKDEKIDASKLIERSSDLIAKEDRPALHRIEMTISLYFPELTFHWKTWLHARERTSDVWKNLVDLASTPDKLRTEVDSACSYLIEKDEEFRRAILTTKVSGEIFAKLGSYLRRS